MNRLTTKRDLHDQLHYIEKLVERLVSGMLKVRAPLETDRYADAIRDMVSHIRMNVALREDQTATVHEIEGLRTFLTHKIGIYEDEWRRVDEGLHNLTPRAEA